MVKLVISSIGKDKPGIVGSFTKVLYDFGCNIEDSSMTILYNQFAMILIITTAENLEISTLKEALIEAGEKLGLFTNIKTLNHDDEEMALIKHRSFMVRVSGSDKTGIAYNVTDVLSKYQINITDFNSKLVSKAKRPIYLMMIETQVPLELEDEEWITELKNVAKKLNVELSVDEIQYCDL
jgi:glycine cleavage system transcriptional repressor